MKKTNLLSRQMLGILVLSVLFLSAYQLSRKVKTPSKNKSTVTDLSEPVILDSTETRLFAKIDNPYYLSSNPEKELYVLMTVVGAKANEKKDRLPLNLSLVIDKSGSMRSERKLEFVKEASKKLIDQLDRKDLISIVTYSDWVQTMKPSGKVLNKQQLKLKVDGVSSGGSTNLSGGMMEGYKQVKSTYKSQKVNRVLLLSDGLANKGITDEYELRRIAQTKFSEDHISISSFGVGLNFNEKLMTKIAENGKGNYYFIGSSKEVVTIFKKELNGLASVVAQNSRLQLTYPNEYLAVSEVYGFNSQMDKNKVKFDYNDIISEEEKTVLIKFKIKKKIDKKLKLAVKFNFNDVNANNRKKERRQNLYIEPTDDVNKYRDSFSEEVTRNKLLFVANQQLEIATNDVDKRDYKKAKEKLKKNLEYLEKEMKKIKPDSALIRQFKTNQVYLNNIDKYKRMSISDQKMMQKRSRYSNYKLKKRKFKK